MYSFFVGVALAAALAVTAGVALSFQEVSSAAAFSSEAVRL